MEIKRCENGHFYDAEANATCPQCAAEMAGGDAVFESYGPTEPAGAFGGDRASRFEDYGPTEPAGGFRYDRASQFEDYGPTEPAGGFGGVSDSSEEIGKTMSESGNRGFMPVQGYDDVTEVGMVTNDKSYLWDPAPDQGKRFSPAVGWLACIEGPARGTDYRVRCGYNYIGRSEHMDICVRGDNQISRERHAQIAYDNKENVFFFGPADGKSIVRVNDKMIMGPTQIQAYDILSVGSTKLLFVPLCGERFNWNE